MSDGAHFTATVRERAARAATDGMGISTIAAAYGVDRKTVSRWVSKYADYGGAALHRKVGSGRPRKLEELAEEELCRIVLQGAIAFGFETDLWTVSRLRRVIQDEFRILLSKNTIWRRLRDAGLTYQKPEREYYEMTRPHERNGFATKFPS